MLGRTNAGGGGKLQSIIGVTYPAGSVCTCSNGAKTLTAKDTSGTALFNVPVGEWTVNCTDGSETASETVSITAYGKFVSVSLDYMFYIFKSGSGLQNGFTTNILVGCTDYSDSDKEKMSLTGAQTNVMSFSPSVDLAKYSTIYFDIKNQVSSNYRAYCGTTNRPDWYSGEDARSSFPGGKYVAATANSTARETLSLDISSVTNELSILIHVPLNGCYVYNIYFG